MISVVIPTLNAERKLTHTLAALVPAVVDGIVQEAVVVDGGSTDETRIIAEAAGTSAAKVWASLRSAFSVGMTTEIMARNL